MASRPISTGSANVKPGDLGLYESLSLVVMRDQLATRDSGTPSVRHHRGDWHRPRDLDWQLVHWLVYPLNQTGLLKRSFSVSPDLRILAEFGGLCFHTRHQMPLSVALYLDP